MPVRYDSDVFQIWTDWELKLVNNTTISDATTLSKGRVRLGTLTDHQSQTAWAVVVQTSNLVKTPDATPSNDENKVPILSWDWYVDKFVSPAGKWGYIGASSAWTDDYVVSPTPAITEAKWVRISFEADAANTGSATLDIGNGAVTIKQYNWNDLSDGDIPAGSIVQLYHDWTNWVLEWTKLKTINHAGDGAFIFGDGSDWDVTTAGDVTLTRDMFYNNLTISSWDTLYPDWYKIYVKGTLTNEWTISRNWNNGSNWADWAAWVWGVWGSWWAALNAGTLWDSQAWGDWADGVSGTSWGNNAAAWNDANPSYVTTDWAAWWWRGSTSWWAVGSTGWAANGWTATRWDEYDTVFSLSRLLAVIANPASSALADLQNLISDSIYKLAGSGGWDSGGSEGSNASWGWGWAGSGGWTIWIAAKIFDNTSGIVESIWWDWWDAGAHYYGGSSDVAGSGGWGWGNGWVFYLIYEILTALWTVTLTWWTWGLWGSSWWVGWSDWWAGEAGATWTTISAKVN